MDPLMEHQIFSNKSSKPHNNIGCLFLPSKTTYRSISSISIPSGGRKYDPQKHFYILIVKPQNVMVTVLNHRLCKIWT